MSSKNVEQFLRSYGQSSNDEVNQAKITTYNSSTFKPQSDLKTPASKADYAKFLQEKKAVMDDKNASMENILKYSAGGKDLTDTSIKSIEKFDSALNQLSSIQKQIVSMKT